MPAVVPSVTAFAALPPDWDLSKLDLNFAGIVAALASQNTYSNFLVDTGIANAYVTNLPAGVTGSLAQGLLVQFLVGAANTGASTLAYAGAAAKSILNVDGSVLVAGQLQPGSIVQVIYNGTSFVLLSTSPLIISAGTWTPSVGGSATYTLQTGLFLKFVAPLVGTLFYFNGAMSINAIGTGSTTVISGLPTVASTNNDACSVILNTSATNIVSAYGSISGATISVFSRIAASANAGLNAVFGAGTACQVSGWFRSA